MSGDWKASREDAIERDESFIDQCAIHAMQALISIYPEDYSHQKIEKKAYALAWGMSMERRYYTSDWNWIDPEEEDWIDPEEESTTE